jgi:hypothetical protein
MPAMGCGSDSQRSAAWVASRFHVGVAPNVADLLGEVLVQVLRSLQCLPVTSLRCLEIGAEMIHHGQGYLPLIHCHVQSLPSCHCSDL